MTASVYIKGAIDYKTNVLLFINDTCIIKNKLQVSGTLPDAPLAQFYLFDEQIRQHIHVLKNESPIGRNFINYKAIMQSARIRKNDYE